MLPATSLSDAWMQLRPAAGCGAFSSPGCSLIESNIFNTCGMQVLLRIHTQVLSELWLVSEGCTETCTTVNKGNRTSCCLSRLPIIGSLSENLHCAACNVKNQHATTTNHSRSSILMDRAMACLASLRRSSKSGSAPRSTSTSLRPSGLAWRLRFASGDPSGAELRSLSL